MNTPLPLEDSVRDILAKAIRGLGLDDATLASRAGLAPAEVAAILDTPVVGAALDAVAVALGLNAQALGALLRGSWRPAPRAVEGLAVFTSDWRGMTVNAAVVHDPETRDAVVFDSGADATAILDHVERLGLRVHHVLLTHGHPDHVADLDRLVVATGASVHANALEPVPGARLFDAGAEFRVGRLVIRARLTCGHSPGGTTYVVEGLASPVAIVGDAVFAGSMGGPKVSFADALRTARSEILSLDDSTVLVPGHGPLTTVGEERLHNPFLATDAPAIGFVGVGRMGANMARRLAERGLRVAAVHDRHAPSAAALADELGCEAFATPAEVAARCAVIFTVVTDDAAQLDLFAPGPTSLLANARGRTFVNCATVSPSVHVEIERRVESAGGRSLEACMASSITQARAGTLYLMCGGREEVFRGLRPLLAELSDEGRLLRHVGPAGTAGQVKALVNMVMNSNTAALAEGLGLGAALGLDLAMLTEVFSQTGAASRVLVTDGADMIARDHACFFSASHAAKDSGIALSLAKEHGLVLPVAAATKAQYDRLVALGKGDLDKSAIAELTFPGRA